MAIRKKNLNRLFVYIKKIISLRQIIVISTKIMVVSHFSPISELHDVFAIYEHLASFTSKYSLYQIHTYDCLGNCRKVTCNFYALIKFIKEHTFDTAYIFGISDNKKILLLEQDDYSVIFY